MTEARPRVVVTRRFYRKTVGIIGLGRIGPGCLHVPRALIDLPNVVATPHAAASTREGLARANMVAARCVVAVLGDGDPPPDCVIADGRVAAG